MNSEGQYSTPKYNSIYLGDNKSFFTRWILLWIDLLSWLFHLHHLRWNCWSPHVGCPLLLNVWVSQNNCKSSRWIVLVVTNLLFVTIKVVLVINKLNVYLLFWFSKTNFKDILRSSYFRHFQQEITNPKVQKSKSNLFALY